MLGSREPPSLAAALAALVARAGDDARNLAGLAAAAFDHGLADEALDLACKARALAPADPQVISLTTRAIGKTVPRWHGRIVRDAARNALYRAAIERAVRPGDRVLDIGAGTGLLSMMAARAGAGAVIGCEMNPVLAQTATRIVAQNELQDRIAIVASHSRAIDAERDLGGRADLIVSEILGSDLLGEGVLPAMADAIPRLLAPGGRVVPAGAAVRAALAYWEGLAARRVTLVEGFDLTPVNAIDRVPIHVDSDDAGLALRSEAIDLFGFDLASGGPYRPGQTTVPLTVSGGAANGIIQWIRVDLGDELVLENAPSAAPRSSWTCLFHPFPGGDVAEERTVAVHGAHSLTALRLWGEPA